MPAPRPYRMSTLKSKLLRPSLTSHFQCWFYPPSNLTGSSLTNNKTGWFAQKETAGAGNRWTSENCELFSISCTEASLPGSTLNTVDITDDRTGVSEKLPYRRLYDDRADFTFYVEHDYKIILFFENWIQYIVNEQENGATLQDLLNDPVGTLLNGGGGSSRPALSDSAYFYRINFPNDYRGQVLINKFEKDFLGRYLQYTLLDAYPIAINSIPVSYDASQLLKCTVSFSFTRYLVKYSTKGELPADNSVGISTSIESL